ncbi:MAG: type II toxin-antitoxin system VapC family toxin [Dehalococcoidia bacterium]|nr:type II toxin-antitoxin system VapC family toxin [Dehalococcoidia bacterium]
MSDVIPHLYLDTNIILDFVHNRWKPSVDLFEKIRARNWQCTTSHFSALEMLDSEQFEVCIQKMRLKGLSWTQVMSRIPERRGKKYGLSAQQLTTVYEDLFDSISLIKDCVTFVYPHQELWIDAERYLYSTNIGARDAIHLATANGYGCNILITRDKHFRKIADEYTVATFPENILNAIKELGDKQT